MGIGLVRQTFDWATIERKRGVYDFTAYDGFVAALAAHHMDLLPVLLDPPKFRSSAPGKGAKAGTYPPNDYTSMGHFAGLLVHRYGPNGTFWAQRPGVPKVPIHSWQIWNEPSLPAYWPTGPTRRVHAPAQGGGLGDQAQGPTARGRLGRDPAEPPRHPVRQFLNGMYKAARPPRVRHTRDPPVREGRRRRGRRDPLGAADHGFERRHAGADLGHRGRLGERRSRQPVHRRRRGPGQRIRSTFNTLVTCARRTTCAGSSTSTGATARRTRRSSATSGGSIRAC